VQSVTGDGVDNTDPDNPVLTFPTPADIGAYADNNPDGFVDAAAAAAAAPVQSVTGTLVGGTASDPVVDMPTAADVGAYPDNNPDGFVDSAGAAAAAPIQSVTGDGVGGTASDPVLTFPTPAEIGAYPDNNPDGFVDSAGASAAAPVQSVNGDTGTVVLDASDVGAYPDTNPSNFIDASGAPVQSVNGDTGTVVLDYADVGADPVWTTTTANSGTLTGLQVVWLADTTSARNRTLDASGLRLQVKDTTGSAETNNITLTAPGGQTINGNATETVDVDYGWVEYVRSGTNWVTIGGQA
jgi:hypothetical protein